MHQSKGLWMLFGNCNLSNWRLGRHGTTKCEVSCWRCPIRIDSVRWWSQWLQVCDVWHGQWRRMCLGCYKCRVHSFFCRCKMLEPWANLAVRRRHDLCTSWRAIQPCHSVSIQTPSLTWPSESFIIFEPLNSPLKWKFDPGTGTSDLWMEWKTMQVSLVLVWKLRKPWKLHVVIVCAFMRLNIESIQSYKVIHWISNDVWWFNMIYVDHLDLLFGLLDPEMLHWGQVGHASTRRMLWLSLQLKRWCAADGWNMLKHVETCWNLYALKDLKVFTCVMMIALSCDHRICDAVSVSDNACQAWWIPDAGPPLLWISNESDMHSKGSAGLRTLKFHQDLEVFEHVLVPERLVNGCEWCGAQLQF